MAKPKPLLEIKLAVTRGGDREKSMRRQTNRRIGDTEKITIQGEGDKKQEVVVRHEPVPEKRASSVWSWYEEFVAAWSETFLTKKKGNPKQGK